uniref:hypothetical protein n=1 Tax=Cyanothece sp. BG0011 TaxID=2082950 RepID=UPI0030DC6455
MTIKAKNYLKIWFLSFLTISGCFAFFNGLIDPYSVVGSTEIKGLNQRKPEFSDHLRMGKAAIINRLKPKGIILGSSRAEQAYDTEHPGWKTQVRPRYNLGLSAVDIYELLRYFQHAHETQSIEQAIVALDFYMFNVYRFDKPDFSENRLAVTIDNKPNFLYKYHDMLAAFLSEDAFLSSITTIRRQTSKDLSKDYLSNGQRAWKHKPRVILKKGGFNESFSQYEKNTLRITYLPPPENMYSFTHPKTKQYSLE